MSVTFSDGHMKEQTRYRTTGAVFLIAVAVICLPMIFDGDGIDNPVLGTLETRADAPTVTPLEDVAPASDAPARAAELRASVDPSGYDADTRTLLGEPVLSQASETTKIWGVQLGTFASEDNATDLRKRLDGDGYSAFLSHVRSDDGKLTRVGIGPILNEADALALAQTLAETYELDARVVQFDY